MIVYFLLIVIVFQHSEGYIPNFDLFQNFAFRDRKPKWSDRQSSTNKHASVDIRNEYDRMPTVRGVRHFILSPGRSHDVRPETSEINKIYGPVETFINNIKSKFKPDRPMNNLKLSGQNFNEKRNIYNSPMLQQYKVSDPKNTPVGKDRSSLLDTVLYKNHLPAIPKLSGSEFLSNSMPIPYRNPMHHLGGEVIIKEIPLNNVQNNIVDPVIPKSVTNFLNQDNALNAANSQPVSASFQLINHLNPAQSNELYIGHSNFRQLRNRANYAGGQNSLSDLQISNSEPFQIYETAPSNNISPFPQRQPNIINRFPQFLVPINSYDLQGPKNWLYSRSPTQPTTTTTTTISPFEARNKYIRKACGKNETRSREIGNLLSMFICRCSSCIECDTRLPNTESKADLECGSKLNSGLCCCCESP